MRYQEIKIINEDEDLFEINMSPGNLDKLASQIDALAGMEFEMIVPDVGNIDLEPEYERDDDPDRRARSFDDVEQFFNDGDYNSRRDIRGLIEQLQEAYRDWKMDQISDDWLNDGVEYLREYVEKYDLFDRDEALTTARDEFIEANPDIPIESEDAQKVISARIDELEEQFAQDEFELQGRIYNDAFEEFSEEKNDDYDESDFLRENAPYMSDVESNFDIQWPYYIDINANDNPPDIDMIADEFSSAIGRPVNSSSRYHGATREKGKYVVEPDGSLEPDDSNDTGLEFVSPPLPLEEMFSDLDKVKAWADKTGCYTNESTGLHINVSVPEFSVDNLDYIKLALLMGDKYVLEQFDRLGNTYAKSAMDKIVDRVKQRPEDAEMLLDKMKEGLGKLATKVIHSGATDKYTSINTKTGYVEFRSPGGDWLGDKFFNQIKPTLSRFVVALDAAMDPQKYRDEYLKKLYKLLQPKGKEDTLSYFAKYAAGEMPKAALKSFIKQAQLERKIAKDPTSGEKYWWSVGRPGYFASVEVVASSKEEAIQKGKREYPDWANAANITAKPIRPYDESPVKATVGLPQPVGNRNTLSQTDIENRLGWPDQTGDANYEVIDRSNMQPVFKFIANTDQDAQRKYTQFLDVMMLPHDTENYGWRSIVVPGSTLDLQRQRAAAADTNNLRPTGPGPWEVANRANNQVYYNCGHTQRPAAEAEARAWLSQNGHNPNDFEVRTRQGVSQTLTRPGQGQQTFTGNWLILDPEGREIHRFGGIGNVQSDANRVAINWMRARPGTLQAGVTVVPEMQ